MADFAGQMLLSLDRPVIDRTGLTGRFEIHLEYVRDAGAATVTDDAGPSIFTAVQEQLGLKLSPDKGRSKSWSSEPCQSGLGFESTCW